MKDKLTVLIPVFNTEPAALLEAVNSMMNQTIGEVPILIIDDASTDADTKAMLHYISECFDNVDVWEAKENGGTSKALNKGHELIATEYIAIMGSDDISDPNRLKIQMEFLAKNPQIDVLGTGLFSFYDHDIRRTPLMTKMHNQYPKLTDDKHTAYGWLVNHGTVVYKNKSVKDVGGYKLPGRAQDVDLWKRMAEAGKKFANIPEVLYAWRRFKQ